MAAIAPDPLIGRVIDGKYQITERIGAGGMGAVYKAVHASLGASRAIKVMKRELLEDRVFVERFQNEARLAESLRHPNLVALYDFSRLDDGAWYIVSEYVQGDTLAALWKRGVRFPSADVAALLGQIADGLALAHRKGIVHRDISPDNIMITRGESGEPVAKLLDFGIAKDVADSTGQTGSGMLLGKIGYSSPEQMGLIPKGERIDERADVFSLSAVAFEMLAGCLPWRKDSLQSYVHDLLVRPESQTLDEIDRSVPHEWRGVFKNGLARQREGRTPSIQALRAEMTQAAQRLADSERGQPATATMASVLPPTETTWRKRLPAPPKPASSPLRLALIGGGLAAVAAAIVGGLLVVNALRPREGGPDAGTTASSAPAITLRPETAPDLPPPVTLAASPAPPPVAAATPPARTIDAPPTSMPRRQVVSPRDPGASPSSAAPTPPPSPAAATAPAPGTLVLRASPEAAVLVDGQPRGRTPLTLASVSAGRHDLVFVADDGRRVQEEVAIAAGETLERSVRFPGFGSLSVTADVWAEVSIDGGPAQQTPLRIERLSAGAHTVRASRPGYKEHTYRVEIKEGDTSLLKVTLEKQ